MLASHGGNVALVGVEPPAATIRLSGACDNCPASALTIDAAIRTAVHAACPEITDIVQVRRDHGVALVLGGEGWLPVCMLADIPKGALKARIVGDRAVILWRNGTAVTCFDDSCAHLGGTLRGGIAEEGMLTCPSHGFRYDLRTGDCTTVPGMALLAHETQVVDGRVLIRLAR